MILAATGHRPNKLGGYSIDVHVRLFELATNIIETLAPRECISGMALGWDTAFAEAAIALGVPLRAALPFADQASMWPQASQDHHAHILAHAAAVVEVCPPGFSPRKMQLRNEYMVDQCDMLVALWDGSIGGTGNCLRYARRRKRETVNLWPCWI